MANEVIGLRDLSAKLSLLGRKMGTATLRKAVRRSATPVIRQMKARAPLGTVAHRSHKGRILTPGFLQRSIRMITRVDRFSGSVSAVLGVRSEAFYGINFLDRGPITITERRVNIKGAVKRGRGVRTKKQIKPYTLQQRPWFVATFIGNRQQMEKALTTELKLEIDKAVKRGR